MAKLGLIFLCVFLMVQLSLAARVVRDAPDTPNKAEGTDSNASSNAFNINETFSTITQGIQKVLSKENVDKFMENLGETGEKLKQIGQGLLNKAQETVADISNSAKKDEKSA